MAVFQILDINIATSNLLNYDVVQSWMDHSKKLFIQFKNRGEFIQENTETPSGTMKEHVNNPEWIVSVHGADLSPDIQTLFMSM